MNQASLFAAFPIGPAPANSNPVTETPDPFPRLAIPKFGIQEGRDFTQNEQDVFPGCPVLRNGVYTVATRPGLGIDLSEEAARRFPITDDPPFDYHWGNYRRRDGRIVKPIRRLCLAFAGECDQWPSHSGHSRLIRKQS